MTSSHLVPGHHLAVGLLCFCLAAAMFAVLAGVRVLVMVARWLTVERSLRPGDWVRFSGLGAGIVHRIGLWFLEIRTTDGTVAFPRRALGSANRRDNAALSEQCRLHATLTELSADAPDAIEAACDQISRILSDHASWAPGDLVARFVRDDLGRALTVEVTAWLQARDYRRYRTWRRQVLAAVTNLAARNRIRCFLL
jgi:hypothetical protein